MRKSSRIFSVVTEYVSDVTCRSMFIEFFFLVMHTRIRMSVPYVCVCNSLGIKCVNVFVKDGESFFFNLRENNKSDWLKEIKGSSGDQRCFEGGCWHSLAEYKKKQGRGDEPHGDQGTLMDEDLSSEWVKLSYRASLLGVGKERISEKSLSRMMGMYLTTTWWRKVNMTLGLAWVWRRKKNWKQGGPEETA